MKQGTTRDHLISTGLKVLHARGFHATGVQDITDAAQVPKGSFYTHFDSKERFGAEVLGRYWERRADHALALGLNTHEGQLTNAPVAEAHGYSSVSLADALA